APRVINIGIGPPQNYPRIVTIRPAQSRQFLDERGKIGSMYRIVGPSHQYPDPAHVLGIRFDIANFLPSASAISGRTRELRWTCFSPFRRTKRYGILDRDCRVSPLMPANFTTLAHFSVSSAISFPKSAGEPTSGVPPKSASRALIVGSARPALISLLSLSTMSAGVFLGAPMPVHKVASKPGTKSLTVETCGSASERVAVVTASARSLPVLTYSIDEDMLGNMTCTC